MRNPQRRLIHLVHFESGGPAQIKWGFTSQGFLNALARIILTLSKQETKSHSRRNWFPSPQRQQDKKEQSKRNEEIGGLGGFFTSRQLLHFLAPFSRVRAFFFSAWIFYFFLDPAVEIPRPITSSSYFQHFCPERSRLSALSSSFVQFICATTVTVYADFLTHFVTDFYTLFFVCFCGLLKVFPF